MAGKNKIMQAVVSFAGTIDPSLGKAMDNVAGHLDKVKIGVAAAEQLYVGQGRGEEKKQYVLDFLKQKGFKVDEESVVNAIEAIVKQLNTEGLTIE